MDGTFQYIVPNISDKYVNSKSFMNVSFLKVVVTSNDYKLMIVKFLKFVIKII